MELDRKRVILFLVLVNQHVKRECLVKSSSMVTEHFMCKSVEVAVITSYHRSLVESSCLINAMVYISSCNLCNLSVNIYIHPSQLHSIKKTHSFITFDICLIVSIISSLTFNSSFLTGHYFLRLFHCAFSKIFFWPLLLRSMRLRMLFCASLEEEKK